MSDGATDQLIGAVISLVKRVGDLEDRQAGTARNAVVGAYLSAALLDLASRIATEHGDPEIAADLTAIAARVEHLQMDPAR